MSTELGFEFHPTNADWDIVQRVRALCPPPEVALQVVQLARDPNVDLRRLASHIELDPTLTAQLLRTVNSAQFGLSTRVNSIPNAVCVLGLNSLRLITTAFGMLNPFSANLPPSLYQSYWRESLTVALVARELATSPTDDACLYFTAGLLSGIGVLAFAQVEGSTYYAVYHQSHASRAELIRAENSKFGTDHIRVGALILGDFGLDSQIVQAILSLDQSDSSRSRISSPLAKVLQLAEGIGELATQRNPDRWIAIREQLVREHCINTDGLLDLFTRVGLGLQEWARLFKLDLPRVDEEKCRDVAASTLANISKDGSVDLSMFESLFGPHPIAETVI